MKFNIGNMNFNGGIIQGLEISCDISVCTTLMVLANSIIKRKVVSSDIDAKLRKLNRNSILSAKADLVEFEFGGFVKGYELEFSVGELVDAIENIDLIAKIIEEYIKDKTDKQKDNEKSFEQMLQESDERIAKIKKSIDKEKESFAEKCKDLDNDIEKFFDDYLSDFIK